MTGFFCGPKVNLEKGRLTLIPGCRRKVELTRNSSSSKKQRSTNGIRKIRKGFRWTDRISFIGARRQPATSEQIQ